MRHLQPERVSPHVWRVPVPSHTLPPADHTNLYVVGSREGVVVWDAGGRDEPALESLWKTLERLGRPAVQALILSHTHPDHVEAAGWLQARLAAPLRGHRLAPGRAGAAGRDLRWGPPVGDGDRVAVGGVELEFMETPGHAPDHLAARVLPDGAVLLGDLLAGEGTVAIVPPEGDLLVYTESLRRVASLGGAVGCPGHGPLIPDVAGRAREVLAHRAERDRQVLEGLAAGVGEVPALAARIYGPGQPERVRPFAEATVRAHLLKLRSEGRVEEEGGRWRIAR